MVLYLRISHQSLWMLDIPSLRYHIYDELTAPARVLWITESVWFRASLLPTPRSLSSSSLGLCRNFPITSEALHKQTAVESGDSLELWDFFLTTLGDFRFSVREQDLHRCQGCQKVLHEQRGVSLAALPIGWHESISNIPGWVLTLVSALWFKQCSISSTIAT